MRGEADAGDDLVWPRERSERVGEFRHFRVRRDWNRSPRDGELRDFYVLEMPDWVQVIAITAAGDFVMVRQFRPGARAVTTEFVAGLVDGGEAPVAAGVRELEEEAGHCGGAARVIGAFRPNAALQDNRLFVVLVEGCAATGRQEPDPGEHIRPVLRSRAEVDAMMADGSFGEAYGLVAWSAFLRWERGR